MLSAGVGGRPGGGEAFASFAPLWFATANKTCPPPTLSALAQGQVCGAANHLYQWL